MSKKPRLQVGQIITLKSLEKDFAYTGLSYLIKALKKHDANFQKDATTIRAKVNRIIGLEPSNDSYTISVSWLDHLSILEKKLPDFADFDMLESEFKEFNEQSYLNNATELSFVSTKLIANKINNSKEIENFLLIN